MPPAGGSLPQNAHSLGYGTHRRAARGLAGGSPRPDPSLARGPAQLMPYGSLRAKGAIWTSNRSPSAVVIP
jgi:hypothetical protein